MGVAEDINWLKADEDGVGKVFTIIASKGGLKLRELKELYGSEDWWPVKAYVSSLIARGLVAEMEGIYRLTEDGKKVFESFKAMEVVKAI
ncbi:MAG: hypothetical protein APZ16_07065 [Candidatus Hadarchaeum yellowstonense]|jgi:coproporphyrinogen III oxidase-like Fe-S oxidoreductase|uniref:ArnR1-like winged helix-turn-helix domain-containing protein n=1 Tax=Hadarchaeum yellowstonense TaxID=1776334 RepID=A0A147JUH5_HADYE|nr:MAG: hypothetical protein APZ16_07065 [Candidatus Hadarchaeum yellowstonense]